MKMASSQVDIAPTSPFGHVLRDRNHQPDRYMKRDSNAFQKNFKDLVQNHLNSCISSNSNLNHRMDYADLWVHNPQGPNNENNVDSFESGFNKISEHSNVNEGSHQRLDFTDLWVHNPQRNSAENDNVKTKSGKWDRARDKLISSQRKSRDRMLSDPVSSSLREGRQKDTTAEPFSTREEVQEEGLNVSLSKLKGENNKDGRTLWPVRTRERENLPAPPECAVEAPHFCGVSSLVSSLVQKWRGFEAQGKSLSLTNSPVCASKMDSGLFFAECPSFADAPMKGCDISDESADLKPVTPTTNEEDSFVDWESCRTGLSGPPSSVGRNSDATESERIRVADIIRKLSFNGEERNDREQMVVHESLPLVRISPDRAEQRTFSPVSHSPRLRGRQMLCDLLMLMEREKHRELEGLKECKPVSRFSHKGRLQAMLRLRFLRHGAELKDGRYSKYSQPNANRIGHSAILRERINTCRVDQFWPSDTASQRKHYIERNFEMEKSCASFGNKEENAHQLGAEVAKPPMVVSYRNADAGSSSESNPSGVGDINNSESTIVTVHRSVIDPNRPEILNEGGSNSSVLRQATSFESSTHMISEFAEISSKDHDENLCTNFQEAGISRIESINGISTAQGDREEQETDNKNLVIDGWASDVSHPSSELEELHSDYMQLEETNRDWISDVSRPRSTWECLRQARYQDMRDPFKENDEIRRLLERKSVSSFLSSCLRERIDRLMVARTQKSIMPSTHAMAGENPRQMEEEKEKGMQEEEEKQQEERRKEEETQDEYAGHNHEYEEDKKYEKIGQNTEANYVDETMSWVRDTAASDNHSDQAASPYIQESPLSNAYSQGTGRSSSFNNHPSVEIELMYELRGNMEQLRQEVAELQRSMKSCMNMQMELQQSIKKDGTSTFCNTSTKKRKDAPITQKFNGGRCCICYDTQIDTLLYRCGHMCTCFKCAHELQWGSGKCPVCRAAILDVVQAYFHPW